MRIMNPKLQLQAAGHYSKFNLWLNYFLIMIAAHCFYWAQAFGMEQWLSSGGAYGFNFNEIHKGNLWKKLPSHLLPYLMIGGASVAIYTAMRLVWNAYTVQNKHATIEQQESHKASAVFDYNGLTSFYAGVMVYALTALCSMVLIAPFLNGYMRNISSEVSPMFESNVRAGAITLTSRLLIGLRTFLGVTLPLYFGLGIIFRRWQFPRENIVQSCSSVLSIQRASKMTFLGASAISGLYHFLVHPGLCQENYDPAVYYGLQFFFWHASVVTFVALLENYCTHHKHGRNLRDSHATHEEQSSLGGAGTTLLNAAATAGKAVVHSVTPSANSGNMPGKGGTKTPKNS